MVRVADVVADDHEPDLVAAAGPHKRVVDGPDHEHRRDRRPLVRQQRAVVDDQQLGAFARHGDRGRRQLLERGLETAGAVGGREGGIELGQVERCLVAQPVDSRREREERRQADEPGRFLGLGQDRRSRPEEGAQAEDGTLAKVVDRRVRDLREALTEEVVDRARACRRETAAGRRRPSRTPAPWRRPPWAARPCAIPRRSSRERPGAPRSPRGRASPRRAGAQGARTHRRPPSARTAARGEAQLAVVVEQHAAARVDEQHLARTESTARHRPVAVHVDRARFRAADDETVLAYRVAQRPQAVAVEGGSDAGAVGEDQPGRPVPRLHERGVVAVEAAHLWIEVAGALPRLRYEHRNRVADVATAAHEKFDRRVELAGVRVEHGWRVEHRVEQLLFAEAGLLRAEVGRGLPCAGRCRRWH